jgi:hypothetical protein
MRKLYLRVDKKNRSAEVVDENGDHVTDVFSQADAEHIATTFSEIDDVSELKASLKEMDLDLLLANSEDTIDNLEIEVDYRGHGICPELHDCILDYRQKILYVPVPLKEADFKLVSALYQDYYHPIEIAWNEADELEQDLDCARSSSLRTLKQRVESIKKLLSQFTRDDMSALV